MAEPAIADWRRFLLASLGTFIVAIVLLTLFIALMNPYGNLPQVLFREHAITDINQRFQYPSLIRSHKFDSAVLGASDARLLKPQALNNAFGGSFVNLAMNAGQAYEQYRMAELFMREVPQPKTLLIGLDHVWCDIDADDEDQRTTFRGFPEWMYDENRWNDLGYMLNLQTVEISGRRLMVALGLKQARFPAGYEVFVPPESAYDPVKVKRKLWGGDVPVRDRPEKPDYDATDAERAEWRFPALAWLDDILTKFPGRVVLAYMPAHIAAWPDASSLRAAQRAECKSRMRGIARAHGVPLIDFNIRSDITTNDNNYWDRLHYRVGIADRIVGDIEKALATGKDDPHGDWKYLEGPAAGAASSNE